MGVQVELMHSNMFVWVYAKVLLGKQNLLAPLFLPRIQITSPCQVGQAGVRVSPWGEAEASGCATIRLSSVALLMLWVMRRSDRVIFSSPHLLHHHQSEKQLAYLLTVSETFSCFWNTMKKGEVRERDCTVSGVDRLHVQAALHTSPLEIIFWHLFIDPLKTRMNLEKPFSQSCECSGKGGKKAKLLKVEVKEQQQLLDAQYPHC